MQSKMSQLQRLPLHVFIRQLHSGVACHTWNNDCSFRQPESVQRKLFNRAPKLQFGNSGVKQDISLSIAVNTIQVRNHSNIPSKQQIERFTYKLLAKTIDGVIAVRSSEGYHNLKQSIIDSYYWSKHNFRKHVIENPKVKAYSQEVQRKIDAAREESKRDR